MVNVFVKMVTKKIIITYVKFVINIKADVI